MRERFRRVLQLHYRVTVTRRRVSSSDHSPPTGFIFSPSPPFSFLHHSPFWGACSSPSGSDRTCHEDRVIPPLQVTRLVCVEVHVSGAVASAELFMRCVYSISFTPALARSSAAIAALPHQRSPLPSLSDPLSGANLQFESHQVSMFHVQFMGTYTDVM